MVAGTSVSQDWTKKPLIDTKNTDWSHLGEMDFSGWDPNWGKTPQQIATGNEQKKQSSIYEDYIAKTKAAQVDPNTIKNQWEGYKGAQTSTTSDYTKAMEKNLPANLEAYQKAMQKGEDAEKAYSQRVANQYGMMEQAQSGLASAMAAAQAAAEQERAANTAFFESDVKGRFTGAMEKAAQEYAAVKAQVQQKMDATDAYYNNTIKPQYAKLMEGGLSLRDASDPSNYVTRGVQDAYEKVIDKSRQEGEALAAQTKKSGQADYGVLAALGNQARGSVQTPMTGAQNQLAQQASMNQASQAYQTAMQRVQAIEDQQRAYAQQLRPQGLQAGMDQSWKNYDAYGRSTVAAQNADIANYNAMLAGTGQLGSLTQMNANTQLSGVSQLAAARQGVTSGNLNAIGTGMNAAAQGASGIGSLAGQISSLAGSEFDNAQQIAALQRATADDAYTKNMVIPGINYGMQSGFNQGDFQIAQGTTALGSQNAQTLANLGFAGQMENFQMGRSDKQQAEERALQEKAFQANIDYQKAQAEAQKSSGMWGALGSTIGTIGGGIVGGIYGGPAGAMAGASVGGSVLGGLGQAVGGGGNSFQAPGINPYAMSAFNHGKVVSPTAQNLYQAPQLNSYWQQPAPAATVGVSPTMQNSALSGPGLAQAQQQYNLGIDPSLMYSPYAQYGLSNSPTFMR